MCMQVVPIVFCTLVVTTDGDCSRSASRIVRNVFTAVCCACVYIDDTDYRSKTNLKYDVVANAVLTL